MSDNFFKRLKHPGLLQAAINIILYEYYPENETCELQQNVLEN